MKLFYAIFFLFCFVSTATAKEFNLGNLDVPNNCDKIRTSLANRIHVFAEGEKLNENNFSFSVTKLQRRKGGVKAYRFFCIAEVSSLNASFEFYESAGDKHYGENRNSKCADVSNLSLNDVGVIGTRINLDQGWAFNRYCQSFELRVHKVQ